MCLLLGTYPPPEPVPSAPRCPCASRTVLSRGGNARNKSWDDVPWFGRRLGASQRLQRWSSAEPSSGEPGCFLLHPRIQRLISESYVAAAAAWRRVLRGPQRRMNNADASAAASAAALPRPPGENAADPVTISKSDGNIKAGQPVCAGTSVCEDLGQGGGMQHGP